MQIGTENLDQTPIADMVARELQADQYTGQWGGRQPEGADHIPGSYYAQYPDAGTRQFSQTDQGPGRGEDEQHERPRRIPELDDEQYRLGVIALGRIKAERRQLALHDQGLERAAARIAEELSQIRLHYSTQGAEPQSTARGYTADRPGQAQAQGQSPWFDRRAAKAVGTAHLQEAPDRPALTAETVYYGPGSKTYSQLTGLEGQEPNRPETPRVHRREAAAPAIGQITTRRTEIISHRRPPGKVRRLVGRAACLLASITPGATMIGVGVFAHL